MTAKYVGALMITLCAVEAAAQPAPRFEAGPLVRVDRVRVEGDLVEPMVTAGASGAVRLLESLWVEGEITRAFGVMERSYSGTFVSFDGLAPTARRDLRYAPGWGGGGAVMWRGALSPRVDMGFKVGLAGRRYVESSTYTLLSLPEGLDEARVKAALVDERRTRSRGGVWFGVDLPIRVTSRVRVIPDGRFVLGPRQVGNAHREWSVGVRAMWGL